MMQEIPTVYHIHRLIGDWYGEGRAFQDSAISQAGPLNGVLGLIEHRLADVDARQLIAVFG